MWFKLAYECPEAPKPPFIIYVLEIVCELNKISSCRLNNKIYENEQLCNFFFPAVLGVNSNVPKLIKNYPH